jgi:hypothetical protein
VTSRSRLASAEVRAARAGVLEKADAAAAAYEHKPLFSTLVGWVDRPSPKPPAIQAGSGRPGEPSDLLISAGEDVEPMFRQLDPRTRQPKPRGPKR